MDDYINRQEAIKALYEAYEYDYPTASGDFDEYARHDVRNVLNGLQSADVQLVKHGWWETWGYIFHGIAWKRCSVCGKTADVSYQALLDGKIEMATPSICGCCGCRMDGDSK